MIDLPTPHLSISILYIPNLYIPFFFFFFMYPFHSESAVVTADAYLMVYQQRGLQGLNYLSQDTQSLVSLCYIHFFFSPFFTSLYVGRLAYVLRPSRFPPPLTPIIPYVIFLPPPTSSQANKPVPPEIQALLDNTVKVAQKPPVEAPPKPSYGYEAKASGDGKGKGTDKPRRKEDFIDCCQDICGDISACRSFMQGKGCHGRCDCMNCGNCGDCGNCCGDCENVCDGLNDDDD